MAEFFRKKKKGNSQKNEQKRKQDGRKTAENDNKEQIPYSNE